jgi:hypothetical protein
MCNIEARPVNTRPVTESFQSCPQQELQQVKKSLESLPCDDYQAPQQGLPDHCAIAPGTGCLQEPNLELSGAPAGKGLQTNPTGWPEGSVRTAGGYTVVPEGKDQAWSIFGPDQKPGEKAMSRVWGDPHVDEKDGTRWDFTKNSNFRLPDGTMIAVDTTSQTGQSYTKGLTIVNGSDRVNISGIDQNRPTTGAITHDGFEYRNNRITENPCRDTFVMGGNGDSNVQWFRERHGEIEGLVTGSKHNVDGQGSYDQVVDRGQAYHVCPNLLPPVGSRAWGNALRSELVDVASHTLPKEWSQLATAGVALDDVLTKATQRMRHHFGEQAFGGLFSLFGGNDPFGGGCRALEGLGDNMVEQWSLRNLFGQNRRQTMFC